jgi:hypothetical protein
MSAGSRRAVQGAAWALMLWAGTGTLPVPAHGQSALDLLNMTEKLDKMDRADMTEHIEEAQRCIQRRNWSCVNGALAKAERLAAVREDRDLVASVRQRADWELNQQREEERRAREAEEERREQAERERRQIRREQLAQEQRRDAQRRAERQRERDRQDAEARARREKLDRDNLQRLADHQRRVREMTLASQERYRQQAAAELERQRKHLESRQVASAQADKDRQARREAEQREEERRRNEDERRRKEEDARREREEREREQARLAEERRLAAEREREQQQAKREQERREREEQARAQREAKEREQRDALDALRSGTRLAVRRCAGGEGRYFMVGVVPQSAKNKVGCIDVSYSAHCPGDARGITGLARNFVGASTDCYLGDTVTISPTPSCPVEQVRVEVRDVRACGR